MRVETVLPVASERSLPKRIARGLKVFFALERGGKSLRVGYLNDDGTFGRSVLVQQTTTPQDDLIVDWLLETADVRMVLEKFVGRYGMDAIDGILDKIEEQKVSVSA